MASTGCCCLPHKAETLIETLDCRGLRCPLPVLKMEKRLAALAAGAELVVLATDPMAKIDIPLFCTQHGHTCSVATDGDVMRFEIVKG
jgi:tRNA 2-thiouridine synthesizing protein A